MPPKYNNDQVQAEKGTHWSESEIEILGYFVRFVVSKCGGKVSTKTLCTYCQVWDKYFRHRLPGRNANAICAKTRAIIQESDVY